jgi:hypothetical protein
MNKPIFKIENFEEFSSSFLMNKPIFKIENFEEFSSPRCLLRG